MSRRLLMLWIIGNIGLLGWGGFVAGIECLKHSHLVAFRAGQWDRYGMYQEQRRQTLIYDPDGQIHPGCSPRMPCVFSL